MMRFPLARLLGVAVGVAVVWGCSEVLAPGVRRFDGPTGQVIDPRCCPLGAGSGCGCPSTIFGSSNGGGDTAGVAIYVEQALICPTDLGRSGGAPNHPNGGPWPDTVVVWVAVDSGGEGGHLPNRTVTLTLEVADSSGTGTDAPYGHMHTGASGFAKSTGTLSQATVNTGPGGIAVISYRASGLSGPITIRAQSSSPVIPNAVTFAVGVPGLTILAPGTNFDTIGSLTIHPLNIAVVPEMIPALGALADSFQARFGRKLEYNDASLPLGGKFDLRRQWWNDDPGCVFTRGNGTVVPIPPGCHQVHRAGKDIDLRTKVFNGTTFVRDFTSAESTLVVTVWQELTQHRVGVEGDHFHLYYH